MATVGSMVRLTQRVVNSLGVLTNPATATLTIRLPDQITTVTPAVTLPPAVTGIVTYDYATIQSGWHTVLWATTTPTTASTTAFTVDPGLSPGLFSLTEAKLFLNENPANYAIDDEVTNMIYVVTEIVERICGPIIPRTITERCDGGWQIALRYGPIISLVSITPWLTGIGSETVPINANVSLDPHTWVIDRNIGFFRGPYKVVYTAGRTILPYALLQGAKDMLSHLWETQRGSSLVGPGPQTNDDDSQPFGIGGRVYTVPRAVMEMLQAEAIGPQVA